MAKIFIKPNPDVNPLVGFLQLEEKRAYKDARGNNITDAEYVTKNYTRAPGTAVRICANPSLKKHGNLNHGMDAEIANPYKDNVAFYDPKFESVLKGKDTAKIQHILEYKHNKPFNYLTDQIIDPLSTDVKDIPVLQKDVYVLTLNDGATVLDTDTEFGEIMYYIVKANNLIANSFEERTSNTQFYIAHEAEEAKVKQAREAAVDRAIARLVTMFDSPAKEDLAKFCKALDIPKKPTNADAAYNELKTFVKRSIENANQFLTMVSLYTEEATRPTFDARVMLYDARYFGIVTKDGASYTWTPPKAEDGSTVKPVKFDRLTGDNSIIEFLSHPKFANEQSLMLEQIKRAGLYKVER